MNETFEEFVEAEDLFEMSNLTTDVTSLPVIVWISVKASVKGRHGPRIKIRTEEGLIPMTISSSPELRLKRKRPKDLTLEVEREVSEWIVTNIDVLLEYWETDGEMAVSAVEKRLK